MSVTLWWLLRLFFVLTFSVYAGFCLSKLLHAPSVQFAPFEPQSSSRHVSHFGLLIID